MLLFLNKVGLYPIPFSFLSLPSFFPSLFFLISLHFRRPLILHLLTGYKSSRRYTPVRFLRPVLGCSFLLSSKKRVHRVGRCRLLKRLRDIGWRRMPVTLSRRFLTSVVIKNSLATCTPAASEKIEIGGGG